MKKAIELFSGNADITKAFIKAGIDTISVDYDPNKNPEALIDDIVKAVKDLIKEQ